MECFAHPNSPAAGTCKSCGKGVCRTCALPVERGLACCEDCRPFAEAISLVQETSIRNLGVQSAQRSVLWLFPILLLASGLSYVAAGQWHATTWFFLAMGGGMALAMLLARRKLRARRAAPLLR